MKRLFLFLITASLLSAHPLLASEHLNNLQSGYLDGFYVQTEDGNYKLKLGARTDFSYLYAFRESAKDLSTFDLLHAKLYFGGNVFQPNFQYYVQFAGGRHQRPFLLATPSEVGNNQFVLEDAYSRTSFGDFTLMAGQFKVPFSKQWMIYSGNLEFSDRSLATNFFNFGRDRGFSLSNQSSWGLVTLAMFNGGGTLSRSNPTGQNVSNDTSNGRGHLYVARYSKEFFGPTGYSESDIEQSEGHRLEFGSGFVFDHGRDLDLDGNGSIDDSHTNIISANADLTWKFQGRSLQTEFLYRHITGPNLINASAYGFYVQPGFMITPGKMGLAGRFGWLDPNDKVAKDQVFEAGASTTYYYTSDHRLKTQLQYLWRAQQSNLKKFDNHLLELLFQWTI